MSLYLTCKLSYCYCSNVTFEKANNISYSLKNIFKRRSKKVIFSLLTFSTLTLVKALS